MSSQAFDWLCESATFQVVDVETTGLDPKEDQIVSIAIVSVRDGEIHDSWQTLVKPSVPINPASILIHNITDEKVSGAPRFSEVATAILDRLTTHTATAPSVLVAHQANFDVSMLTAEMERHHTHTLPSDLPVLDTMRMPKVLLGDKAESLGGRPKLADLCHHLGVTHTTAHDALADATATAHCLLKLLSVAVDSGHTDIDELHELFGNGTVATLPAHHPPKRHLDPSEKIPAEHWTTHQSLPPVAKKPLGIRARKQWLRGVLECCQENCPLLGEKAENAIPHAATLHPLLLTLYPQLDPDDARQHHNLTTMLGILTPHAITTRSWKGWWRTNHSLIHSHPACPVDSDTKCVSCENGEGCPPDMFYQALTQSALGCVGGVIPAKKSENLANLSQGNSITSWANDPLFRPIAGFAAWLAIEQLEQDSKHTMAAVIEHHAHALGLETVEPRLCVRQIRGHYAAGNLLEAEATAAQGLAVITTDPEQRVIEQWMNLLAKEMASSANYVEPHGVCRPASRRMGLRKFS